METVSKVMCVLAHSNIARDWALWAKARITLEMVSIAMIAMKQSPNNQSLAMVLLWKVINSADQIPLQQVSKLSTYLPTIR